MMLPRTKAEFLRQYPELAQLPPLQDLLGEKNPLPIIRQQVEAALAAIDPEPTGPDQQDARLYRDFLDITKYAVPQLSELLAQGLAPLRAWASTQARNQSGYIFVPESPDENLVAEYLSYQLSGKYVATEGDRARMTLADDDETTLPEEFSQLLVAHAQQFPRYYPSDQETWDWLKEWKPGPSQSGQAPRMAPDHPASRPQESLLPLSPEQWHILLEALELSYVVRNASDPYAAHILQVRALLLKHTPPGVSVLSQEEFAPYAPHP